MNDVTGTEKTQPDVGQIAEVPEPRERKPHRMRRLILKVLLVFIAFLLLLVALAPTLLSTKAGTSLIVSVVNKNIRGKVDIDDLLLSWAGPIEVRRLRLHDPSGREVLSVRRLVIKMGVWSAIWKRERFQFVSIDSPSAVLYAKEEGDLSISEALQGTEAKPKPRRPKPKPQRPLPAPRGRVSIRRGSVRFVPRSGRDLIVRDVTTTVAVRTLNDIGAEFRCALAEGGDLALEMTIRDLARGGTLDPARASGNLKVHTPSEIELAQLASVLADQKQATGRVNLSLDATLRPGGADLRFDAAMKEFSLRQPVEAQVLPISVTSKGNVEVAFGSLAVKELSGDVSLNGEGVDLETTLAYRQSERPSAALLKDIAAGVLEGKGIELPDLALQASGEVDMVRLGAAVPSLLKLREDLQLTGGVVHVSRLAVEGGATPRAEGSLRVENLSAVQVIAATNEQKDYQYKPITADFDASLVENEGLQVNKMNLEADFATLQGQGSPKKMEVHLNADLSKLPDFSGRLQLTAGLQRAESVLSFKAEGSAKEFSLKTGERRLSAAELTFDSNGTYALEPKAIDGMLKLTGTSTVTTLPGKADKPDTVQVGSLQLEASLAGATGDGLFASGGSATIASPVVNGEPLPEKRIVVNWSDVKYSVKQQSVAAGAVKVEGEESLSLSVSGANARFGDQPTVDGSFALSAELSKLLASLQPFVKWEKPPAIAGAFTWNGQAATTKNLINATGTATVADLRVGSGERVFRQGKVELAHGTVVDVERERITLEKLSLASQPLSLSLSGTVDQYKGDRLLDLSGNYRGSWEHLMALLNELSPSLSDQMGLVFSGETESELRITGPASQPKVQPVFRGIATNSIRVDWTAGHIVGFELGPPTNLQPMFSDGRLLLKDIKIPASGGSINLNGVIDFSGETPVVRMEGQTRVIEKVRLTPEVGRMLLSRINPIFGQVVSLEGDLSLSLVDINLPLGGQILKAGSGTGKLDISNLSLKPDGILANLVQLSGLAAKTSTKVSFTEADFTIMDGKISYENFAITFGKDFDLRFRGSVGFDDALEMYVSLPVGSALLKGFGFKGPLDTYSGLLAKERVRMEIPIRGTRLAPELGEVKLDNVLQKVTTGLLRQGVQITGDVLTLPVDLLKRPDSLLKVPGKAIKKSADVITTPFDLFLKPKETLSDPGALFDRLNVTPEGILIESLLESIKKEQEKSPGANPPKQ